MRLTIKDIVSSTGGRLLSGRPESEIKGVSIDSRSLRPGEVFFALRGKERNGHDFVEAAYGKGAIGAVIEEGFGAGGYSNVVSVGDTLKSVGDLASFVRGLRDIPLIAVSGSSGKTTTKEMIASILSQSMTVLKTSGNMNNLLGLPLTLLSLNNVHDCIVAELGISERGEMKRLSEIARPDVAVITNIGRAHLEGLSTVEMVAKEKLELYASLDRGGVSVVNLDDPLMGKLMGKLTGGRKTGKVTFGKADGADVRIKECRLDAKGVLTVVFEVRAYPGNPLVAKINSPFLSNAYNAAAAIAAVVPFNAGAGEVERGLGSLVFPPGRMGVVRLKRWIVMDDTYNANPDSVGAALKTLASLGGRRVAVLGDMHELGEGAYEAHVGIGRLASECGLGA
ncbi:MAG: UDP-N-acetylmuramoyl-tripeptide--D-alanyl-D-alanine ligase, partial [Deltaproteobacteria bacterium]|nr:UDP-N-acetylmuramoyl-tripeptide--D-alanyl-D-alanine ligase [Deltaproteobacteria bacterium]